jgi:pyruvate/2-oxoglutarate dehydrogenase complex dihydrolipoamide dehydrogenase (E3) component
LNALFGSPLWRARVDCGAVPRVTYTDPEVAAVGHNETSARDAGVPFEVTTYDLADLDRAIADGSAKGTVKVLTVPGRDRLLGATVVGRGAGETLAELTLALSQRLCLGAILGTVHPYPTLGEANRYVAGAWRRAHTPRLLLGLLPRLHRWRRGRP